MLRTLCQQVQAEDQLTRASTFLLRKTGRWKTGRWSSNICINGCAVQAVVCEATLHQDRLQHALMYLAAVVIAAAALQVGAFFTSIPQCVLGGMTTFLFAGVCVSGIKVCVPALSPSPFGCTISCFDSHMPAFCKPIGTHTALCDGCNPPHAWVDEGEPHF